MSVQFGRWNFAGQPPAQDYIDKVGAALAPYGPDSNESYSNGGIKILYRAFHTTQESRRETQPHISPSGAVITWDGRLDNRAELISELRDVVAPDSTDAAIVSGAYDRWGADCFAKLVGDWALSIWSTRYRSLILAKDPIGVRHLYYRIENDYVVWSTILDPIVLLASKTFTLCEEYFAGWFSYFPAAHLTPYVGVHSVPPASFVRLRPGQHIVSKYWDFAPGRKIHYRADAEYEEHFRVVFGRSVQRRLRSDRPVLADLSGGMDSSSIVCIADAIMTRSATESARLDTISWYDDTYDDIEPDTNELRYITKVEEKRDRTGYHIDLRSLKNNGNSQKCSVFKFGDRFEAIPSPNGQPSEQFQQYAAYIRLYQYRVALSGIGGDEVMGGGVPTPTPELQNFLARGRFFTLARQLTAWSAKMRKKRLSILWKAARGYFTMALVGASAPSNMSPLPWLSPAFVRGNYAALCGYPSRVKLFGPLPSLQNNIATLNVLRRLVANQATRPELLSEVRFPYLDRDLLEFLFSIPREQVVGVGVRRSLMKRALIGIVPSDILNRRRKAFLPQGQPKGDLAEWCGFVEIDQPLFSHSAGIIDSNRFLETLANARRNQEVPNSNLVKTMMLEFWLRHLTIHGVRVSSLLKNSHGVASPPKECHAPEQSQSSAS